MSFKIDSTYTKKYCLQETIDATLGDCQIGDIVYVQLSIPSSISVIRYVWRKVRIIEFFVCTVSLKLIDRDPVVGTEDTIQGDVKDRALTEEQHESMQLEKRFSVW